MHIKRKISDPVQFISTDATFSPCKRHRYTLKRVWAQDRPVCMFLMLNPSTADENMLDPTVRKCVQFADSWGYGTLYVANIFALRSPYPEDLYKQEDPIGVDNDENIFALAQKADLVIGAWGTNGKFLCRGEYIIEQFKERNIPLHALHVTQDGNPGHPLYLNKDLKPKKIDEFKED